MTTSTPAPCPAYCTSPTLCLRAMTSRSNAMPTWLFMLALCLGLVLAPTTRTVAADQERLRSLDSHCPFTPPENLEQWESRAKDLRLQLRVAVGLLPYPILDSVKPQIYAKREMDGYCVEKCTFESLPGLLVTGTLYRPASVSAAGKVPAVLCPHGHWPNGRFYKASDVPAQLASGAERFEAAAINPMQARCVQLARMGCVVYQYDMLGYADSQQISFARAHSYAKQPAETEVTDAGWLLYSPMAESHTQSVMGLQTLATFRAVDMLLTLPEVDPQRIGITGASGGGTQTFIAAALDPRISVAFPAVMVSTGMQGGCTCENSCLLRTGTNNVEIAALFAPKPLGLTAADDWTRTMPSDGFPQLQSVYEQYGKKGNVALFPALHFGHNYNHVSRVSMYGWMNDYFGLGFKKPILEADFQRLEPDELTVWDAEHPKPEGGEEFERQLMKLWAGIVDSQMKGMQKGDLEQQRLLIQTLRDGWRVVLGLTTATSRETQPASLTPATQSDTQSTGVILHVDGQPPRIYHPSHEDQPLVQKDRLAAAYTLGYNLSQFARQAQQLGLAILDMTRHHPNKTLEVSGHGVQAALAASAVFCAEESSRQTGLPIPAIHLKLSGSDFRFANAKSITAPDFLPGSARYQDLPGLVSCLSQEVEWR